MKKPYANEKPAHQVTLTKNYYIGQTPVTQALWKAVMGKRECKKAPSFWQKLIGEEGESYYVENNPSYFDGDNMPVENVSWDDCQEFISKLNAATGKHFRLPTEAEWEFAARGGNNSKHYQYSGSNKIGDVGWYCNNSEGETHDVATKEPNELGVYDMSGNVWEWCNDLFGGYISVSQTNPTGHLSGTYRVRRGGSWNDFAGRCRSSCRFSGSPDDCDDRIGLRLALSE